MTSAKEHAKVVSDGYKKASWQGDAIGVTGSLLLDSEQSVLYTYILELTQSGELARKSFDEHKGPILSDILEAWGLARK